MRNLLFVVISVFSTISYSYAGLESNIQRIQNKLGVTIVLDKVIKGSWEEISYKIPSDTNAVIEYLQLLDKEFSKYPVGYFNKVGVRTIAITQELTINSQLRAAIPDPYKGILFLSLDNSGESDTYLIHVMHHELHHCAEYKHWNSMSYLWDPWALANTSGFSYQGGGASAYENPNIDWYSMNRPIDGFINKYSTTAQEEDRAEIVAAIMTESEKEKLDEFLTKDEILQQKVLLIKILLTEISGESKSYWNIVFE